MIRVTTSEASVAYAERRDDGLWLVVTGATVETAAARETGQHVEFRLAEGETLLPYTIQQPTEVEA